MYAKNSVIQAISGRWVRCDSHRWNFTKFLVGRDGRVLKRYAPTDKPESIAKDIEAALP